jgi:hypothetical protein
VPLCRHPNNRYRFLLPANGNESLNHTSLDLDACTQRPTNSRCPLFYLNTGTMPASLIAKPRVQVQAARSRPRPIYGDISENRRRVASNWPSSLHNMNKTGNVLQRNIEACSMNHCCSGTAISITYCVCTCSLRYPSCNAHVSYYLLWPVGLCHIFPHYLINGMIFGK